MHGQAEAKCLTSHHLTFIQPLLQSEVTVLIVVNPTHHPTCKEFTQFTEASICHPQSCNYSSLKVEEAVTLLGFPLFMSTTVIIANPEYINVSR